MINKLKRLYRRITRPVGHLNPCVVMPCEWMGNEYGGFYIAGDTLKSDCIVYSFGIGQDVSFDLAMIEKFDCHVYGYDPTPKSVNWISKQSLPDKFKFSGVGVASASGNMNFHLPTNSDHVSGSIVLQQNVSNTNIVSLPMLTLSDIMERNGHSKVDIIKMDIEGAEYDVVELMLKSNVRPKQLLIEFHDRFFPEQNTRSKATVEMLKKEGYSIFAISDTFEEVSFIHLSAI